MPSIHLRSRWRNTSTPAWAWSSPALDRLDGEGGRLDPLHLLPLLLPQALQLRFLHTHLKCFDLKRRKISSHIPMSFFHLHCQGGPRPVKLECPGDEGWWFIVQPAFKRGWWSWWWSSWWCWSWQWWSWWCWSSKWWTKWRGWAIHSSPAVPPSLYYPRDDGRDGGDDHGGDDHGGGDERRCVNAFLSSPPSLYYSQVSLYLSFSLSEHSYHHHQQLYQTFKSLKNEVLESENDMGRPFAREGMISAVSSEPFRVGATFTLFFHWNTWWQWWYFFLILFNTDIFWVPLCESPPQLCTGYTWPPPTAKSSFQ